MQVVFPYSDNRYVRRCERRFSPDRISAASLPRVQHSVMLSVGRGAIFLVFAFSRRVLFAPPSSVGERENHAACRRACAAATAWVSRFRQSMREAHSYS